MVSKTTHSFELDGSRIDFEIGKVAQQASGAVVVRHLKSWVLATVVAEDAARPGVDFLPLTVEYRERLASGARIPGAFGRREGRITEHEVLTSRLIDRTLRPLFPAAYRCETQVQVTVFSADPTSDLEVLGMLAAFAAVHLSDIPFDGPVAGLRVARTQGRFRFSLPPSALKEADLNLVVGASREGFVMVEGGAALVADSDVLDALDAAMVHVQGLCDSLEELRRKGGKPKRKIASVVDSDVGERRHAASFLPAIEAALEMSDKASRRHAIAATRCELLASDIEGLDEDALARAYDKLVSATMRRRIVDGKRIGGRANDAIRAIDCETGLLEACHGSALFTRGETQALVTTTLGGQRDAVEYEDPFGRHSEPFFLHYTFPPYSVGEARPIRGPGRREIGHGRLARRALEPVIPPHQSYPFTIRVTSDVTASNGSSSMATVCGGTLAMLDAGVPLKAPVAGIAMGLIAEGDRIVILSDILGDEDHLGDMDFKVAGTADRITAVQLDNKLGALSREVLAGALTQAAAGRAYILAEMASAVGKTQSSEASTGTATLQIPASKVGRVIGRGGSVIQALQSDTGTRVEVKDDGRVFIFGSDPEAVARAVGRVEALVADLQQGGLYRGTVVDVKDFGAFVRIGEHEALVHVSELDRERVNHPGDIAKKGDSMLVKVLGTDNRGRLKLSRKAALGASPGDALNA